MVAEIKPPFLKPFSSPVISCGIFMRLGGVSPPPFDSLNISRSVGDDFQNVLQNRQRMKESLQLSHLIISEQIHKDKVASIEKPLPEDEELNGYDAMITNVPGVGIMIQQADCQAIMLFDPVRQVVANIHSGWKGSVANIISKTIDKMVADFAINPENLHATISPSLGPCCAEFVNYKTELPVHFTPYMVAPNYFDFWAISKAQLLQTGVKPENIALSKICTMCDHRFYSYRREGKTGRSASVIGLRL